MFANSLLSTGYLMNIIHHLKTRYTTKLFDPNFKLTMDQVEQVETLLRYSPSSTNAQPWHFFITGNSEGKSRIAKSTSGFFSFNEPKILQASHVIVLCSRTQVDEPYLQQVLTQEMQDGRFAKPESAQGQHSGRSFFVNMHRYELRDATHWADKQVYLALGNLLLGASALDIDACPMEGFNATLLDDELGLREKGLTSTVIVALGRRAENDFNAKLPKSRLPTERVITHF